MKNIKTIVLDKYNDPAKYETQGNDIFKKKLYGKSHITFECELEEGEDSQYPLDDLLDKYMMHVDYFDERTEGDKSILVFELVGDYESAEESLEIVGARVYNVEDGEFVSLVIE